jgi:hypothetical protein
MYEGINHEFRGYCNCHLNSLGILACAVALMGCGGAANEKSAQAQVMPVPAHIQKAMAAEFPADGQIHVQSKGKIRPDLAAAWCRYKPTIADFATKEAPNLLGPGYDELQNGEVREPLADGTVCTDDGRNIASKWVLTKNRKGKPYKLVLVVWQGDAFWAGSLERTAGKRLDVKDNPPFFGADFWLRKSIEYDINDVSSTFKKTMTKVTR